MGLSQDPSLLWSAACDLLRLEVTGLSKQAGFFVYPSVEAAALELSMLLADREREVSGTRTTAVYGVAQDPALDQMAKALSGTGLDASPKNIADLNQAPTWFSEQKAKILLVALAEDDRFTGAVHDVSPLRTTVLADAARVPVLSFSFGSSNWRTVLPKPFEIRISEVALSPTSFVTIAIAGERLRLEPRFAPLAMEPSRLNEITRKLVTGLAQSSVSTPAPPSARDEIERFESMLPKPFKPWWPKGASRRLDRAIVTSAEHDGSWVIDQIRPALVTAFMKDGISEADASEKVDAGLFSLSGCVMNDERRQEWLRGRGDDAWLVRGAIHVSHEFLTRPELLAGLKKIANG